MPADVPTEVFREWGKANGFKRSGTTLHREQADTIAVVNLQGSQYGGRYYLNVALWLKALGDDARPRENHCHIRTRLGQLTDERAASAALDMQTPLHDDERRAAFGSLLDTVVTPALAHTRTLDELRQQRSFLSRCLVTGDAQRLLADAG